MISDTPIGTTIRIACRNGMEGITVRKIAAELGSSIAPVYVNFSDLEEVRDAVVEQIVNISRNILDESDTGQPFRDIGIASVRFARRYPVISRDLTLRPNRYLETYRSLMDDPLTERMEADSERDHGADRRGYDRPNDAGYLLSGFYWCLRR